MVAAKGPANLPKMPGLINDAEPAVSQAARAMLDVLDVLVDMVATLTRQVTELDWEIARRARNEDVLARLMMIPGIGLITATAIVALAPLLEFSG